jgi:hypothetical protein
MRAQDARCDSGLIPFWLPKAASMTRKSRVLTFLNFRHEAYLWAVTRVKKKIEKKRLPRSGM